MYDEIYNYLWYNTYPDRIKNIKESENRKNERYKLRLTLKGFKKRDGLLYDGNAQV